MHLEQLKLTNFRNYEFQNFSFSKRLNLIAGLNGMGKTNLLDAVYYLCMGKSHFTGTDRNVVKQGEHFFRLEGHFDFSEKKEKIVAKVQPGLSKLFERNDNPYMRLSDHIGFLPIVFKAPDDTKLVVEGSEERRRFIDNTLCQLNAQYLDQLVQYNKLLQKRNALLKQFAENHSFDATLLKVFDQQMEAPAIYLAQCRIEFVELFSPIFNSHYQLICEGKESVSCIYKSQLVDNNFSELLSDNIDKDRILQRTTIGPHKDDLQFKMNGRPLKSFASQGQLKSFVLALKLAQFDCLKKEKSLTPILLLDDLFDKLDDQRVRQLVELLIKGDFGQVFITDTHPDRSEEFTKLFDGEYKKFLIENGNVIETDN